MLKEILRSPWFSAGLQVGLWLLLVLTVVGIGGRQPQFGEADAEAGAGHTSVPVAKLESLFAPENWPKNVVDAGALNPFATTHFIPTAPTPPPPPTTRKIEMTYQGFYRSADGPQQAMMRLGDQFVVVPVGGLVVSNLWVVDAAFQTLTLTNSAAQTNVLTVNVKKAVEVPLK